MKKYSWSVELPWGSSGSPIKSHTFLWKSECLHDQLCIFSSNSCHKDPDHHIFQKFCRGSLVRFLHMVYLPILNIIPQLSYYWYWFDRNNIVNTPFYQLIVKNITIIKPNMSWITFINIKYQFTFLKPTWFNTGICIKNSLFLWYINTDSRPLPIFYCLNVTPRMISNININNFGCDPTCLKISTFVHGREYLWYLTTILPLQMSLILQIKLSP